MKLREAGLAERESAVVAREANAQDVISLKQKELEEVRCSRDRLRSELHDLGSQLHRIFLSANAALKKAGLGDIDRVDQRLNIAARYALKLDEIAQLLQNLPTHIESAALAIGKESVEGVIRVVLKIVKSRVPSLDLRLVAQGVDPAQIDEATAAVEPAVQALLPYLRQHAPAAESDDDIGDDWLESLADPKGKSTAAGHDASA